MGFDLSDRSLLGQVRRCLNGQVPTPENVAAALREIEKRHGDMFDFAPYDESAERLLGAEGVRAALHP